MKKLLRGIYVANKYECSSSPACQAITITLRPLHESRAYYLKKYHNSPMKAAHQRLVVDRLAMAAAEAKSGLPDTLRCATRGRLLEPLSGAPFAARLTPTPAAPGCPPWAVECRRCGAEAFTGELLEDTSRLLLTAVPFLKLVAGGSGSGDRKSVV